MLGEPARGARRVDEGVAGADGGEAEDAADPQAEEGEPLLAEGEAVGGLEYPGEGGEEGVLHGEDEGDVEREEADDGLRQEHVDGPADGVHEKRLRSLGGARGVRGGSFGAAQFDAFGTLLALGAALEDLLAVGFGHEEGGAEEGDGEEEDHPLRPPPALALSDEASDQWTTIYVSTVSGISVACAYPRLGPKKGAQTMIAIGMARSCGAHTSDRVALPTLNAGLPKHPAKKRHTVKLVIEFEKPEPSVNRPKMGVQVK